MYPHLHAHGKHASNALSLDRNTCISEAYFTSLLWHFIANESKYRVMTNDF